MLRHLEEKKKIKNNKFERKGRGEKMKEQAELDFFSSVVHVC